MNLVPLHELARRFHQLALRFAWKRTEPRQRAAQLLGSLPARVDELHRHGPACSCSSCCMAAYRVVSSSVDAYFARKQRQAA